MCRLISPKKQQHTFTVSSNFKEKHNSIQKTLYLTWLFTQESRSLNHSQKKSFTVPSVAINECKTGAVYPPSKEQVYRCWWEIQTRWQRVCCWLQRGSANADTLTIKKQNKRRDKVASIKVTNCSKPHCKINNPWFSPRANDQHPTLPPSFSFC